MRTMLLLLGAAAVIAAPSFASAATRCQQNNRGNEVAGTVVGALAGGLIGNAVSRGHSRGTGTAVGAVAGGVIGNRLAANSNQPCPDGYYAYDDGVVDGAAAYQQNGYQQPTYQQPAYQQPAYQQPADQGRTYSYDAYGNRVTTYEPAPSGGYYDGASGYNRDPRSSYSTSSSSDPYGRQYSETQTTYTAPTYSAPTYSDRSYSSQQYSYDTSGYGQTWQDSYGRTCRWSMRNGAWAQVCR